MTLQVIKEGADQRRVEVADVERAWRLAGPLLGVAQQQPERVPVRGDGVRAGSTRMSRSVKNASRMGAGCRSFAGTC